MNFLFKWPALLLNTGLFVFSVLCPGTIQATEPFAKVVSNTGSILGFQRGVRNLGLGGIGAADPCSPDNVYYNPAVVSLVSGAQFTTGHNDFYTDIHFHDYGGYAGHRFGLNDRWSFRLGGGLRYTELKSQAMERTIFLPEGTGRTFGVYDDYFTIVLGCGLSIDWFDFGFGVSLKPVTQQLADYKMRFNAYDIGFLAQGTFDFDSGFRILPSFGVSQLNLGSDITRDEYQLKLPEQFRVGIGVRMESPPSDSFKEQVGIDRPVVSISAVAEYVEDRSVADQEGTALGIETSILDIIFLRINHADNTLYSNGASYGFGIGWQFKMVRLRYDYARVPLKSILEPDHMSAHGGTVIVDF